jgi:hypothetical protein
METYSFAIHVTGVDLTGEYEGAFYEAGCDDALITVIDGRMRLDFDREAAGYKLALASAMDDVERAGARVLFVEPLEGLAPLP